jgi:integrase
VGELKSKPTRQISLQPAAVGAGEEDTASVPIESAMNGLIEAKLGAGRSERYCNDLRLRLGLLCAAFKNKTIAQISTGDLESFLANLNVAPETRNTFRRDIRTLWSFAEKRGWAMSAIAKNTERSKAIEKPPGILNPAQAAALLAESKDDDLLAFHAIGLFAGLRVAEIKALNWKDVDLAGGSIHVGAKISKTRARRLVPILENLRAWLQPIARLSGPIVERELRYRHEAARELARIKRWPENCMRHSFVSYRLAATRMRRRQPLSRDTTKPSCLNTTVNSFDRKTQRDFSLSDLPLERWRKRSFQFRLPDFVFGSRPALCMCGQYANLAGSRIVHQEPSRRWDSG